MNVIHIYVEFTDEAQVEPLCEAFADVLMAQGFGVDGDDSLLSIISVKNPSIELDGTEHLARLAMEDSSFVVIPGATDDE